MWRPLRQEQRAPNVNNRETPHQALSSHVGYAVAITIPHVDTSAFHRHIYDHKQARSPCESERDVDRSAAQRRERGRSELSEHVHMPQKMIFSIGFRKTGSVPSKRCSKSSRRPIGGSRPSATVRRQRARTVVAGRRDWAQSCLARPNLKRLCDHPSLKRAQRQRIA